MSRENPCTRLTVGGADCQHQIKERKCPSLSGIPCSGRKGGLGHDMPKAERLVTEQKNLIAVEKLIKYQSTEEGLGHLSNRRAVHSSPVPFSEMRASA